MSQGDQNYGDQPQAVRTFHFSEKSPAPFTRKKTNTKKAKAAKVKEPEEKQEEESPLNKLSTEALNELINSAKDVLYAREANTYELIDEETWESLREDARVIAIGRREEVVLDARVKVKIATHWIGRALKNNEDEGEEREESVLTIYNSEADVLKLETAELLNRTPKLKPEYEKLKQKVEALKQRVKACCEDKQDPEQLEAYVWDQINRQIDNYSPRYYEPTPEDDEKWTT